MAKQAKVEVTAESIRKAIQIGGADSFTQIAHMLGFKGSVSSSLTKKIRDLVPDASALMAVVRGTKGSKADQPIKVVKLSKADIQKAKRLQTKGKLPPRHPANKFREGSSYGICFDLLAEAGGAGLPRERLIALLAKATNKDIQHAAFDAQVVCSARKNDDGLNPFEGSRNRSCKMGFYVERTNGHVKIVLPPAKPAAKEQP